MKIALWAENLAYSVASLEEWAKLVAAQAAAAKGQGAEVLLMPEYSAAHWLHFIPKGITGPEQFARVAGFAAEATRLVSEIAVKQKLLIVPGSFPVPHSGLKPPYSNRAHILFPDGKMLVQDKLCLTPPEKDPSDWAVSPGDSLTVFTWQGYRMAVVICLDIELPALSARLAGLNLDLILVPSMTWKPAGYHRVLNCAKARTVELLTAVATVGAIAGAPGCEQYVGGADFLLPCEEKFGHTGVLASIPPAFTTEGAGPLLVKDLPLEDIRTLRQGGADVWPGAWTADHVEIKG
jgi:predicted amidohydrolase